MLRGRGEDFQAALELAKNILQWFQSVKALLRVSAKQALANTGIQVL
jgi:DNA repair protein RadC